MRNLTEAHLPTFFKILLQDAAQEKHSYEYVGWHLGTYHRGLFVADEEEVLNVTNADLETPTATLRRLFASEEHPDAGVVDYIPAEHRESFLQGLVCGVEGGELEKEKEEEDEDEDEDDEEEEEEEEKEEQEEEKEEEPLK